MQQVSIDITEPNYWWLMLIAVIPVVLAPFVATWVQKRRKNVKR